MSEMKSSHTADLSIIAKSQHRRTIAAAETDNPSPYATSHSVVAADDYRMEDMRSILRLHNPRGSRSCLPGYWNMGDIELLRTIVLAWLVALCFFVFQCPQQNNEVGKDLDEWNPILETQSSLTVSIF
jgi:hypothetical protein